MLPEVGFLRLIERVSFIQIRFTITIACSYEAIKS